MSVINLQQVRPEFLSSGLVYADIFAAFAVVGLGNETSGGWYAAVEAQLRNVSMSSTH